MRSIVVIYVKKRDSLRGPLPLVHDGHSRAVSRLGGRGHAHRYVRSLLNALCGCLSAEINFDHVILGNGFGRRLRSLYSDLFLRLNSLRCHSLLKCLLLSTLLLALFGLLSLVVPESLRGHLRLEIALGSLVAVAVAVTGTAPVLSHRVKACSGIASG